MAKLITCKDCGGQLSKSAKICPHCGAKRKPSAWRVILGTILLFAGIILFSNGISGNISAEDAAPEKITMQEFSAIETGMTYAQVVNIVGADGELLSTADIGDSAYKTEIYVWYGFANGSNANVTFQGGKVIAKAQSGLS